MNAFLNFASLVIFFCAKLDAKSHFTPRIFELAKVIEYKDVPTWTVPAPGGILVRGDRLGPIDPIDLIQLNGYPAERHFVETEDGYILEVHRIPNHSSQHDPVILLHGNFMTSADWLKNTPVNNSFAFTLHSLGFDVWLGNHRGNMYSRYHKVYPMNSNDFWDFSFHEMGTQDMPAMIDYALALTGKRRVHYISFSYSTSAFVAGLSSRPEYNEKLTSGIIMGPMVMLNHFHHGIPHNLSWFIHVIDKILDDYGALPILPHSWAQSIHSFLVGFCHPSVDVEGICGKVTRLAFGDDKGLIRQEQYPLLTSTTPSSSGLKQFNHLFKIADDFQFRQYDYGPLRNLVAYGSFEAPLYNFSSITTPIAVFSGPADTGSPPVDGKLLASKLPNLIAYYEVPESRFNHMAFAYGREVASNLVYYPAGNLMKDMENKRPYRR